MDNLIKAQLELNNRLVAYYQNNNDGGNEDEKFVICSRVAEKYDLDVFEEMQLIF